MELGAAVTIIDAPLGINKQIRIIGYERTLRNDIIDYTNVTLGGVDVVQSGSVSARKFSTYQTQHGIDGSATSADIANRRSSRLEYQLLLMEAITQNFTVDQLGHLLFTTFMQMQQREADGSLKTDSGISGLTEEQNAVRFWAGETFENRENAPFRVRHDGSLHASTIDATDLPIPPANAGDIYKRDVLIPKFCELISVVTNVRENLNGGLIVDREYSVVKSIDGAMVSGKLLMC